MWSYIVSIFQSVMHFFKRNKREYLVIDLLDNKRIMLKVSQIEAISLKHDIIRISFVRKCKMLEIPKSLINGDMLELYNDLIAYFDKNHNVGYVYLTREADNATK